MWNVRVSTGHVTFADTRCQQSPLCYRAVARRSSVENLGSLLPDVQSDLDQMAGIGVQTVSHISDWPVSLTRDDRGMIWCTIRLINQKGR